MPASKPAHILLAEDDRGTCELESQHLAPLGLEVRKAYSAQDAIRSISEAPPELLLLDYSLPGGSALQLIAELNKTGRQIPPFIIITGRGDERVAVDTMKAGAIDYIIKNADFLDILLPSVKKALDKISLKRQLRAAQESTAKNLRLYTILARVNQASAQLKDREKLLNQVCGILAEDGGFRLVCVGCPDRYTDGMTLLCSRGAGGGPEEIKSAAAKLCNLGAAAAARPGPIAVFRDLETEAPAALRDKARRAGCLSAAAVPLRDKKEVFGVLNVYSAAKNAFSEDELSLLREIQSDISLAIEAISSEEEKSSAKAALERTATQLARIMEAAPVILFTLRLVSGRLVPQWVSGNSRDMLGYDADELLSPGLMENALHPEDRDRVRKEQAGLLKTGGLIQDFRVMKKDGSGYAWVHSQLKVSPGRPDEITGSWSDVSQLKESELRLRELLEKGRPGGK
ncbi:MAG TPA: hypothetical protein DEQ38_03920 [Elusimicrobia bacterium]|nr:MAG: hypothetical protein A2089_13010 [Elusimicrobia bacterium GWD2_63_28]HCC47252.1 hypothetical protein [Elusimicrobiota bacterium]